MFEGLAFLGPRGGRSVQTALGAGLKASGCGHGTCPGCSPASLEWGSSRLRQPRGDQMWPEGLQMGRSESHGPAWWAGGSSSAIFPHRNVPVPFPPASPSVSRLAPTQGAPMPRLGQRFQPLPLPGSAVLGIFPRGQMVSLGTFAQSSCHWQEMTNMGLREVPLKWGPGAQGYGLKRM